MTIEVPAAEVYALAATLTALAGEADEITGRLAGAAAVDGPLQPAIEGFLACHRTAAAAVAGELRWLGGSVAAVVDSWLGLDGSLLAAPGEVARR
jgi:hypothetical protein